MIQRNWKPATILIVIGIVACLTASAQKDTEKASETERKVTEAEVPKAALKALQKQARKAKITEFAEEIEHGSTFYEGSWKKKGGAEVDVLVTKDGALVEIEEKIPVRRLPAGYRSSRP